jgi:hypothetical protein
VHRAVLGVQHLGRGKAREDLDAERFGLLRQKRTTLPRLT